MVYKINAIPDNLLIDPQGKIVARGLYEEALKRCMPSWRKSLEDERGLLNL
jgi:hypothetical protein